MSSARKRSSLSKAHAEIDHLKQQAMLNDHHYSTLKCAAETIAMKFDDAVEDVRDTFNRVINHAIALGLDADQFLRCWREGDRAGCREFDFEVEHAKEQAPKGRD